MNKYKVEMCWKCYKDECEKKKIKEDKKRSDKFQQSFLFPMFMLFCRKLQT
jgi:hypothetical protein